MNAKMASQKRDKKQVQTARSLRAANGVSAMYNRSRLMWRLLATFIIFVAFCLALANSSERWSAYLLPVKHYTIEGQFSYLDTQDLQRVLNAQVGKSLLFVSLADIEKQLNQLDWIENVALRRSWPSGIHAKVDEHKPMALFIQSNAKNKVTHARNKSSEAVADSDHAPVGLISSSHQLFVENIERDEKRFDDLTRIYAPRIHMQAVLEALVLVKEQLAAVTLSVDEIYLSKRGAWTLELSNGTRLNVGRQDLQERVARYVALLPVLKNKTKNVAVADLRYDTGIAVQWRATVASN